MKRILLGTLVVASLGLTGATQKSKVVCDGFAPKNNLNIPADQFTDSGITQDEWTSLFDKYEKIYTPIIAARGGTLSLNRLWDDGTVNANASQNGGTWTINMYGGLARYPNMTKDGMMLVVCHETGHHLGGSPKVGGDPAEWASNEGAADYFAVLKCMRNMIADEDNGAIVSKLGVEPTIQTACSAQYADAKDAAMCQRISTAGTLLGRVLNELSQGSTIPTVDTPDTSVVDQTDDSHPAAQCRLDTYFQGSICTADVNVAQGDDYHTGSCTAPAYKVGLRPACWFKADAADSGKAALTSN